MVETTHTPPRISDAVRTRIAFVIFIAQSFFSASVIAAFTLSPIIATALSGSEASAGFPNTLGLVGRAAFAYPFGYLMDQLGRRLALSGGYGLGVFGALISVWAVMNNSYAGFLAGALLLGMARAASDQSRYVAAEIYPTVRRAKVIGWIVFAGTMGAIFGPLLVVPSGNLLRQFDLADQVATWSGPFAVAAIALLLGTLTLFFFLRPDPLVLGRQVAQDEAKADVDSIENTKETRSIYEIFSAPLVQIAVLSMVLGYFVMAFLMVITPVHMDNHNHGATAISGVIMAHTMGMFGLSGLTGWLIDRFGRIPMIYAGVGVLISGCITAPLSTQVPILGLALFLIGLGWNFAFVSGSSLLSDALNTRERARGQAASEVLVALAAGTASFAVGSVFQAGDYITVSIIGFALTITLGVLTFFLYRKHRNLSNMATP